MIPKTKLALLVIMALTVCNVVAQKNGENEINRTVTQIQEVGTDGSVRTVYSAETNAGSNLPTALRTGGMVGSLPGEANVLPNGSANYSIPIFCTPGVNGMQPNLSINYNSGGGNGIMGLGWSISGYDAVTRGAKDAMHYGNDVDGVDLDADDRFYLNGQLLIAVNGIYGQHGTEYITETNNFSKITSYGQVPSPGSGPEYFEVETRDGMLIQYGWSPDAGVEGNSNGTILMWRINRINDANGNGMTYQYSEVNRESLLTGIYYILNNTNYADARISFKYENRAVSTVYYVAGNAIPVTKQLDSITCVIYDDQTPGPVLKQVRKYDFTYGLKHLTNVPLLTRIDCYGDYTNTAAQLNSTNITWGGVTGAAFSFQTVINSGVMNDIYYQTTGDFDGNGVDDFMVVETGSNSSSDIFSWFLMGRSGTIIGSGNQQIGVNDLYEQNVRAADLNGDGKDELIFANFTGSQSYGTTDIRIRAFSFNGSGFSVLPDEPWFTIYGVLKDLQTGDFNGDGKIDILLYNKFFPLWYNFNSEYHIFSYNNTSHVFNWLSTGSFALGSTDQAFYPIDYNGDGKTEILNVNNDGASGTASEVYEFSYNGSTWVKNTIRQSSYPNNDLEIFPGDYNGDGITDLITWGTPSYYHISFGTGAGYTSSVSIAGINAYTTDPSDSPRDDNVVLGDFNGDGKSDFVKFHCPVIGTGGYTNVDVHYSKGDGTFTLEQTVYATDLVYATGLGAGDFNGDGKTDVMNQKLQCINSCSNWFYDSVNLLTFHANEQTHLAQTILNGYDALTEFDYETITTPGVYTKGTGAAFPLMDFCKPMYVATGLELKNGLQYIQNESYKYEGAKLHLQGRGLLGFSKVTATDAAQQIEKEQSFDIYEIVSGDKIYLPYKTHEKVTSIANGMLIKQADFNNDFFTYNPTGIRSFFFYVDNIQEIDYLKIPVTGFTTQTFLSYTANTGNLWKHRIEYGGSYTIETENTFTTAGLGGTDNKIHTSKVTTTRGSEPDYVTLKEFTYHPVNGNLEKEKLIANNNTNNFIEKVYGLNSYGLVDKITTTADDDVDLYDPTYTSPVKRVDYVYDGKHRFVTEMINAAGQKTLYKNDVITGNVLEETGVDGLVTQHRYDAFGKKIQTALPRGTGIDYTYAWETSQPPGTNVTTAAYSINRQETGRPYVKEYFDAFNRLVCTETIKMESSTNARVVYKEKGYDGTINRLAFESKLYYMGDPVQYISYSYEPYGRLASITDIAAGNSTTTAYNGFDITTTYPNGATEVKTYDALGNIVAVTDRNTATMEYYYHSNGKIKEIVGANGNTSMEYDNFGGQTKLTDPDAGETQYIYNAYGDLIVQKDARNNEYKMTYSILGQMESKEGSDGKVEYFYGQATGQPDVNKPTEIKKYDVSNVLLSEFRYAYDNAPANGSAGVGDLVEFTQTHSTSATGVTTKYTYDANGNVTNTAYTTTGGVTFNVLNEYDANNYGYLTGIKEDNASNTEYYWQLINEDATGKPLEYGQGQNGVALKSLYSYDATTQLPTGIEFKDAVNNNTLWHQLYEFDSQTGNLNKRTDNILGIFEEFVYNSSGMFLEGRTPASNGTDFSLVVADDGNINSNSLVGNYSYGSPNLHAVTQIEDDQRAQFPTINATDYIPGGTVTQNIKYTPFNKVETITEGDNQFTKSLSIEYAPDNERIFTAYGYMLNGVPLNGKHKYFFGNYERRQDQNLNGDDIIYVNSPYGLCAARVTNFNWGATTTNDYYIRTDYLGSIMMVTETNGNVVEENSFDAWGRRRDAVTWQIFNQIQPATTVLMFDRGYTGHEHLQEFGLINMNGRMYDPVVCRMLSVDNFNNSAAEAVGFNRYAYALNNPLKYNDPSGQWVHLAVGAVIGGTINWIAHGAQFNAKGLGHFGVGALAGAVSAGVGAGIGAAIAGNAAAGGGFAAGFWGTSTISSTGFVAGAAVGGGAGFTNGLLTGIGNGFVLNQNIGQAIAGGLNSAWKQAIVGGVTGGILGGIHAIRHGRDFWSGSYKQYELQTAATASTSNTPSDEYVYPEDATVANGDVYKVYYKSENGITGLKDYVSPGNYIKESVDGVATSKFTDQVFKIPDGGRILVSQGGEVSFRNGFGLYEGLQMVNRAGWQNLQYFSDKGAFKDWINLFGAARNWIK
ncbi:MAG TPA: FG-GAP-like repeat-containing protein [Bacteroidia bacterium]|nr:FG-GAP-like repeat-containing protein [Bacteroidia bacterium]HNU34813.1 FG-GAP-like repeat-containing protein [Bacteroidia bacterium]